MENKVLLNTIHNAYVLKTLSPGTNNDNKDIIDRNKLLKKLFEVASMVNVIGANKTIDETKQAKLALEAKNNAFLYKVLASKLMFNYFSGLISKSYVSSLFTQAPHLKTMLENYKSYKNTFSKIGVESGDCPLFTKETLAEAYSNSLLEVVTDTTNAEDTLKDGEDSESEKNVDFDKLENKEEESIVTDKKAEKIEVQSLKDKLGSEDEEDEEPDTEKEMLEAWRKAEWANIEQQVNSLLETIARLYRSGIESMAQPGIFLNNGGAKSPLIVVKYREATESESAFCGVENKLDSGLRTDLKIINAISSVLPNITPMQGIDPKTNFPTLDALYTNEGVMHEAHLMFQSVSIPYSGVNHNKNSIKKWVKDTKGKTGDKWIVEDNRSNKVRINKYKDAEAWFKWVLENTLYRYFNDAGLKPTEPTEEALDTIDKIVGIFAKKFKNVVVVAERESKGKVLQSTELRICTDTVYDTKALADSIAMNLNSGNAKDITASARNTVNQVTAIRIVYDQKSANASMVFASQIAQSLIDGGNTPKWNKVLLGRTQNGEFLFWEDFMYGQKAEDRAYAIYAGSGAGKGIMTLTLMAAAISDKKQLFYTDAKPDSGASIGALAWKDKKEMYMFDGQAQGGDAFPGYLEQNPVTNGMRDPQETLMYKHTIPKGIFKSEQEVRRFLGVCRYLRSLTLCAHILTARGNGKLKNSPIPEEDFQVWVFDEMTSMSSKERQVRQSFASYIKGKGYKFANVKKDQDGRESLIGIKGGKEYMETIDPNSDKYDQGVAYIADWLNWTSELIPIFTDLSVIGLRNAQANIFFIFQNAEWISNEKDGAITTIAAVVQSLKCRKFVGANGLAKACGDYGDGNTMRAEWANQISTGGWWAVSNASDIRSDSTKMTIFKPYSIWGFRKAGAVGNDDRYLDYYCDLILGDRISASEVLQSAWDYAENAVQALGKTGLDGEGGTPKTLINPASSLKDYIYNVERFALAGSEYDPNDITNQENTNADFNSHTDNFNKNILENENNNGNNDTPANLDNNQSTTNQKKDIDVSKPMPSFAFRRLSEDGQRAVLTRVIQEMKSLFKLDDRANNTKGLKHLCWNLSILYITGKYQEMSMGDYHQAIRPFCINYYNQWLPQGEGMLDKMPGDQQVIQMAGAVMQNNTNNFSSGTQNNNSGAQASDIQAAWDEANNTSNQDETDETNQNQVSFEDDALDDYDLDSNNGNNGSGYFDQEAQLEFQTFDARNPGSTTYDSQGRTILGGNGSINKPMGLNNNNYMALKVDLASAKQEELLSKLWSKSGYNEKMTENLLKSRVESVLKAIQSRWGKAGVRTIRIENNTLYINGVMIDTDSLFKNNLNFRFVDVIKIDELLKTFRNVNIVELDAEGFQYLATLHYEGFDAVTALFKLAPGLRKVRIQFNANEAYTEITKGDLRELQKTIKKNIGRAEYREKIKVISAIHNPRLGEKGLGFSHDCFSAAKRFGGGFADALTAKNPKLFAASASLIAGGVAAGAGILVGGVSWVGNKIGNMGKDK